MNPCDVLNWLAPIAIFWVIGLSVLACTLVYGRKRDEGEMRTLTAVMIAMAWLSLIIPPAVEWIRSLDVW